MLSNAKTGIVILTILTLSTACGSDDDSTSDTTSGGGGGAAGADVSGGGAAGASGGAAGGEPLSLLEQAPQTGDWPNIDDGARVPESGSLDYSDPEMWLCRPGLDWNWCLTDQDATALLPDGNREIEDHEPAAEPEFDCFYLYPTVTLLGPGVDLDFAPARKLDPLLSQASRLSSMCRVFAPMYRQVGLLGDPPTQENIENALADSLAAFDHYMAEYNEGWKFVLLGHSQGSSMLTAVLNERFEGDADRRGQMISAILAGANVTVPEGETTGGSFATIPVCAEVGQTGCIVSWATYADDNPPAASPTGSGLFGENPPGETAVCTSPQQLAGNGGKLAGSYFPLSVVNAQIFSGDVSELQTAAEADPFDTDYIIYRDAFDASCVTRDGYTYYEASLAMEPGDVRPPPPWRNQLVEDVGMGLHIVDWNLVMGDALDMIRVQAEAALSE